ncbi:glycoside hydrolase family 3 protein [Hydrogenimonas sp.]
MRGRILLGTLFLCSLVYGADPSLERAVARTLIVGVPGAVVDPGSPYAGMLRRMPPGGVILFDGGGKERTNILSPERLKRLTADLRRLASAPIFVGVDQEGGRVQRLKPSKGFVGTPSARTLSSRGEEAARRSYRTLAKELKEMGIDLDFAPVVDLALNPNNGVIVGRGRAYGKGPEKVVRFAKIFIDALCREGIVPVLKHFPGHGSSTEDTHEGVVDVTRTWRFEELKPYELLLKGYGGMVMTGHLLDRRLDPDRPATLSYAVVTGLLRKKLGFDGVVVSDDLLMKAISARYGPERAAISALNAGVDMLLFADLRDPRRIERLVQAIAAAVERGEIARARIEEANRRIERLRKRCGGGER